MSGTGRVPSPCPVCMGTGTRTLSQGRPDLCSHCNGTGDKPEPVISHGLITDESYLTDAEQAGRTVLGGRVATPCGWCGAADLFCRQDFCSPPKTGWGDAATSAPTSPVATTEGRPATGAADLMERLEAAHLDCEDDDLAQLLMDALLYVRKTTPASTPSHGMNGGNAEQTRRSEG